MTPSSPSDDVSSGDEDILRAKVLNGLRLAVNKELNPAGTDDRRDLTKTEEEKLLYFAIQDLELPLTYSWYLAGAKIASTAGTSSQTASPSGPNPNHSISHAMREAHLGETEPDPEIQRYRDYYQDTTFFDDYNLKTVIYTDKTEFLCDFYDEFAPDTYTDLYLHSTKLREKLDALDELITQTDQDSTLQDWGAGSDDGILSGHKEKEIRHLVSQIHLDLTEIDQLEPVRELFTAATDEIEIILTKLTHTSSLTEQQQEIVTNLDDFFYDYPWKYPALTISAETATGPNAESLSKRRENQFSTFHETLSTRTEALRKKRVKAGLRPSPEEFASNESTDVMGSIHEMTRSVLEDDQ